MRIPFLPFVFALLSCVFSSQSMADERVPIGTIIADGSVRLAQDRFRDSFPGGARVTELSTEISNGFLRVVRKGFQANGACIQEYADVVDSDGLRVAAGTLTPGRQLFFEGVISGQQLLCSDSGCDETARARCNITEKSGGKCRCHVKTLNVPPFYGEVWVSPSTSLCSSVLEPHWWNVSNWVFVELSAVTW